MGLLPADDVARLVATNCSLPRIAAERGMPGCAPGCSAGWWRAEPDGRVVGAAAGGVPGGGVGGTHPLCAGPGRRRGTLLTARTDRTRAQTARTRGVTPQADGDPALPSCTAHGSTAGGRGLARTV
ncbi:GNAT family N-acetyltransferase [Streptomyces sp. MB22_4]|uniref:GNAT family N-acetyltransferase n=1 Tax=Streptomyces sp. MB22_4 TaxID=3383120 RepID=UPI00399F3F16